MDPQKITELANLFRVNGDKILNSEFTLTLSGSLLRALNDSFTLIADSVETGGPQQFEVVKAINSKSPVFRDLQLVHDFVQKTTLLCIVHYPTEEYFTGCIDISKFHALRRLETRKVNIRQIVGIQPLRAQLQHLICIKSLTSVDEIITHCGGDHSNGFVWNELKTADFSYNNLQTVDSSLEFAQYLQHLNLRHNQLCSVEAIKWLPHLKFLDLSYNCLQCIPQFHTEAYKRLLTLNMSNNFIEDLMGIAKMDALNDLDLSDNCLLDHTCLLPLSAVMTLRYLNLYGNPLYCHPKHRLATAQFLHKNTATVKFLLDSEPLSKNEKAVTGKQQLRNLGSLNRFKSSTSVTSIASSHRGTPNAHTPASSIGSLHSFRFQDTTEAIDAAQETLTTTKRKANKVRTVEIEDEKSNEPQNDEQYTLLVTPAENKVLLATTSDSRPTKSEINNALTKSLITEADTGHLEAKKQIENLREKYGAEWLQSGNAEMMHSVLGIETIAQTPTNSTISAPSKSRQIFNDFLGEFSATAMQSQMDASKADNGMLAQRTSTPKEGGLLNTNSLNITPIEAKTEDETTQFTDDSIYMSIDNTLTSPSGTNNQSTLYTTANDTKSETITDQQNPPEVDAKEAELRNVYAATAVLESEDSEPEAEETYIVYTGKSKAALFLTLSENFLREKDTWTQRTKTKWSLKILESCERLKANTLRINFDTVKTDKKERIYTVEDGLCQELEKKLRNILSKRDLSEMNQTIYRCINCSCQFSRENKMSQAFPKREPRCPDCNSNFIAEVHEISKSVEKPNLPFTEEKLSPAAIVEESPITTPLVVKAQPSYTSTLEQQQSVDSADAETEFSTSIGSATSLNESSSCSKISVHSESSFDSNQSVVGSTNSERDLEFNVNCESDVDIISNPSQSSIEVLDPTLYYSGCSSTGGASRKTSEERRISQQPNLETIDDNNSYKHTFTGWPSHAQASEVISENAEKLTTAAGTATVATNQAKQLTIAPTNAPSPLTHVQLTESSSSGSVTDSICTTYAVDKPRENEEKLSTHGLLTSERIAEAVPVNNDQKTTNTENLSGKKEESGLTSMFGALFQSTNILMSSSKKLIDAETTIKSGEKLPPTIKNTAKSINCITPYKFNYSDFNDIDHRLKLYFYQSKFQDTGEHFKWLVRGRIYNENTRTLLPGIVVMSTSRLYLMEAYAPEDDVVTKWLRQIVSVTTDRLETIQLLPWKLGCAFMLRDWGGFLLLLQDILRTDSLMLYFANNSLPPQCELVYQPAEGISKRLNDAAGEEKLKMFALLNDCEISCDNALQRFSICGLLTTDSHLYLTTDRLAWLSQQNGNELEHCVTQLMSNLVDVEYAAGGNICAINFLDETANKCETWRLTFETKENAECCLNAIGQSWQQLFGVSLFGA